MEKLKIRFTRVGTVVCMQVLSQDKRLRGGNVLYNDPETNITLVSYNFPDIYRNEIHIRGNNKHEDDKTACFNFESAEAAHDYLIRCKIAVRNYNATLDTAEETAPDDYIETIIAE